MVEIRNVGNGRFEVFAEDFHWEAFTCPRRAREAAEKVASEIARAAGNVPAVVEVEPGRGQSRQGGAYAGEVACA